MKFAAKLSCVMMLVLAVSLSAGGCMLLYGDFSDRLAETSSQNQVQHGLLCYTLEGELLTLYSQGDAVTDAALLAAGEQVAAAAPDNCAIGVWQIGGGAVYSDLPQNFSADAMQSGQLLYYRDGGTVYAVYCTDLLGDARLLTAFDVTELYLARSRSVGRFLVMEFVVLLGAALVTVVLSRRITRPLALLTRASGEITAGAFDRRTALPGGDEVAQLSRSFDHMAAAVQDKVEQLELSVQQRDDFMGAFTHELKTPMTSIIGYADMLRSMQVDPAEQKEAAGAIFHEAKRLESLSQKLLQLMRLSEEPVALAPTALAPVFAEVARSTLPACHKAGVRLRLPTTRRVVMADADLLCDLLCNLVTNAVKASRPGQTVRVLSGGAPDGSVVAGVIDSGAGIPPEAVARVVEPFYMVDKSRARKSGGSGIGLALCQRIAQAHGSQLHIRSTLGKGTCVTLTLRPARLPDTAGPTDTEDAQKEVQP